MRKLEVDNKLFKNDVEYMKFLNKISNNKTTTIFMFIFLLFSFLFLPEILLLSLIILLFSIQFFFIYTLNNWQKPLTEVYSNSLLSLLPLENLKSLGFDFYNRKDLSKKDIFNFYCTNERLKDFELMNKAKQVLANLNKNDIGVKEQVKEKLNKDNKKIEKFLKYLIISTVFFLVVTTILPINIMSTILISLLCIVFFVSVKVIPNKYIIPYMQYSNEEKVAILSTLSTTQKDRLKIKMIDYYIRYNKELNAIEFLSYLRQNKMI